MAKWLAVPLRVTSQLQVLVRGLGWRRMIVDETGGIVHRLSRQVMTAYSLEMRSEAGDFVPSTDFF